MIGLSPRDWTTIGAFGCAILAAVIAGIYGLGRDENWKWQVTTEENRVPAFFVTVLILISIGLFAFGPKDV